MIKPLREITLPDGSTVYNVPNEASDNEVRAAYQKPSEPEEKSFLDYVARIEPGGAGRFDPQYSEQSKRDLVKATVNMGSNAYEFTVGTLKSVFDQFETEEEKTKFAQNIKEQRPEVYKSILKTLGLPEGKEEAFDEKSRPQYETATGTVAELAPYFVAPALLKSKLAIAGGELLTSSLVANPEDNLIDGLKEFAPTEEAFNAIQKAILSEDLSPEDEQKAKLFLGDMMVAGFALPFAFLQKTYRLSKEFNTKPMSSLTEEEKTELSLMALRDAQKQVEGQASSRRVRGDTTGQIVLDSVRNLGAAITRFGRQFFTSSGFMPEKLYRDQLNLIRTNKQAVENAGFLSKKLDSQLNILADQTSDNPDEIKALVSELIQEGIVASKTPAFLSLSRKEDRFDVIRMQAKYDSIPDNVVDTVLDIREVIDSYSGEILRLTQKTPSSGARTELINTIRDNLGGYLNRAYQKHEGGWTPSKQVVEDGIEYFAAQLQRRDKSLDPALAYQQAEDMVNSIIATPDLRNGLDFDTFNRVTTGIIKKKEDIKPEVRALMGEIIDPSEQALTTITKMSAFLTQRRFFDEFYEQGTTARYLFSPAEERNTKLYTYQIEGTNSRLDGMWTTPEMGIALQNRETSLFPLLGPLQTKQAVTDTKMPITLNLLPAMLGNKSIIANLAEAKGASQKMQTVWRLLSHLRNGAGGSFLAFSNGHNPFKNVPEVLRTISKSNEEMQGAYERLQGLGVVSSSTRFSEFKELLNEYKTAIDSPDELVAAEKIYGRLSRIASKIGTEKYNLQTADELLQKVYVGTDDFFKTSLYFKELETLRQAYPAAPLNELEEEAASIVTKTMPVYEEVFKGIKSFRNNPFFSTFVSFPAEMYRTTIHKFTRATAELASGNSVLMKRGAERVAGLAVTLGGVSAAERTTSKFLGWSEEQLAAYKDLNAVGWGEQSYVFSTDDEGKPIAHNISYTDPHQNVKAPILRIATSLREGESID